MLNKEIQEDINNFFKECGKNKPREKEENGCIKNKKRCPYTISGECRGYCSV